MSTLRVRFVFLLLGGLVVTPVHAADEPDLIFKRSTVFKFLTPDEGTKSGNVTLFGGPSV